MNGWRKSSFCNGGTCVEVRMLDERWHKAEASAWHGSCAEARAAGGGAEMRDSKDRAGPTLRFTRDEWEAFTAGIRAGEFDLLPPGPGRA